MSDEDQVDTIDLSFELPRDTVVEVTPEEVDPQEDIATMEQPALSAAPL